MPSGQLIYRKSAGILVEIWNRFFLTRWWKVVSKTWCSTTEKTETCHGNVLPALVVARTTRVKQLTGAGFVFLVHKSVLNVSLLDWCARVRQNVRHFLIRKGIFDWKRALERLRSHEQSVEHIDATIIVSSGCKITVKNWYRTSQSGQSMRTILKIASARNVWFLSWSLLLSEDWRLEMMKTLDRQERFPNIFKTFFKQN